jgi:multiple sugar transport system permease protein
MTLGKRNIQPYIWLFPTLALLGVLLLLPLLANVYASVHELVLLGERQTEFVGFEIYRRLIADPLVATSLKNTLIFTLAAVFLQAFLGTVIAVALNAQRRLHNFFIGVILLPMMLTPIVVALMWKFMWDTDYGFINYLVSVMGFAPHPWLGDSRTALSALILTDVWQNTSFVVLIVYGALQTVPNELLEAASVDGARGFDRFRYIVFPLIAPALLIAVLIRSLFSFRVFETIFVLTDGGPANATLNLGLYLYRLGFRYMKFSSSAGLAWIMFFLCLVLLLIYFIASRWLVNE